MITFLKKNKIAFLIIGFFVVTIVFGQEKKLQQWDRVISEMKKVREGDTISKRNKSILEWTDFKMSPDLKTEKKTHVELTFGVFVKNVNIWNGRATVESFGGIRRDLSWIKSEYKTQELLDYTQLKYDISHYFAKKSEKEINIKKINAGNVNKINGIIELYLVERDKALYEFDLESDNGNRLEILAKWKQKLLKEEI